VKCKVKYAVGGWLVVPFMTLYCFFCGMVVICGVFLGILI